MPRTTCSLPSCDRPARYHMTYEPDAANVEHVYLCEPCYVLAARGVSELNRTGEMDKLRAEANRRARREAN